MNFRLLVLLPMFCCLAGMPMSAGVDDLTKWMRWMESTSPDKQWSLIRMEAQPLQRKSDMVPPDNLVYFLQDTKTGRALWAGTEYQDNSGGTPPLFCWNPDSTSCVVVDRLGRGEVKILVLSLPNKVSAVSFDPGEEIARLVSKAKGKDAISHSVTIVFYDDDFRWIDGDHCEGSIEAGQSEVRWKLRISVSTRPIPKVTILGTTRLDHRQ